MWRFIVSYSIYDLLKIKNKVYVILSCSYVISVYFINWLVLFLICFDEWVR